MFKAVIFAALLALAVADPEPKAKPGFIAAAYSAPVVSAAYSAPVVSAYSAGAPVVSAYSSPYAYRSAYGYAASYAAPYAAPYAAAPYTAYNGYASPYVF